MLNSVKSDRLHEQVTRDQSTRILDSIGDPSGRHTVSVTTSGFVPENVLVDNQRFGLGTYRPNQLKCMEVISKCDFVGNRLAPDAKWE